MTELKRTLGLWECIFFGVGSILGAGIYALMGKVAGISGYMIWLSFFIAFFGALCTAFSYAELSAAYPKAGGEYVYARKAFGDKWGLIVGLFVSFNGIVSGATVSVGFAGYLDTLTQIPQLPASLAIVLVLYGVNITGIRQSSLLNILFTIIEVSGLAFVIFTAFNAIGKTDFFQMPSGGMHSVLAAGALAFFAYMGFEEIVKLAEETKDPVRHIPKALLISSLIVVVIYVLVGISAVSLISPQQLGESESPLADVVGSRYGQAGITIISVIALFATSNTILSNMLGSSRVLLNIAKDTPWLGWLGKVARKRRTPVTALTLILFVTMAFALIGSIETIARITTIFVFLTFILVNLAAIILRLKAPKLKRPYKMPLNAGKWPLISVMGIVITLVLLGYTFYSLFFMDK